MEHGAIFVFLHIDTSWRMPQLEEVRIVVTMHLSGMVIFFNEVLV